LELVSIRELARRRGCNESNIRQKIKQGFIPEECFVTVEGDRHRKIDYDAATFALDACTDAATSQEQAVEKLKKGKLVGKKQSPQQQTNAKEAEQQGASKVTGEENNVKTGKADDKPKEKLSREEVHAEQFRKQKFDGLVLDNESGYYFADDVQVEDFEGKKIVTAKDVLLTNAEKYQKHRALTEALKAEQLQMKLDIDKGILVDGEQLRKRIMKIGVETRDAIQNIPEQYGPDLLACKDLIELQTTLSHAINKALENLKRLQK